MNGVLPVVFIGDIQMDKNRFVPVCIDVGSDLLALGLLDVANNDPRSLGCKHPCVGRANTTRPA